MTSVKSIEIIKDMKIMKSLKSVNFPKSMVTLAWGQDWLWPLTLENIQDFKYESMRSEKYNKLSKYEKYEKCE